MSGGLGITDSVINVGDIYLDCDGVRRRCVEADGDEVYGVAVDDTAAALWCSHEHCRPQRVAGSYDPLVGRSSPLTPSPWRCTFPGCAHPDLCEGTHAVPNPRPPQRWRPTRKWKGRR